MKYIVDVNGRRREVTLDRDGVHVDGEIVTAHLGELARTPFFVLTMGDSSHLVRVRRGEQRGEYAVWLDGHRFRIEALDERTRAIRDLDVARQGSAGPARLTAPMPGLIIRVLVVEGQVVQPGDGLVVIEAMKMENELRASSAAKVRAVHAEPGSPVEKGALLIELETADA